MIKRNYYIHYQLKKYFPEMKVHSFSKIIYCPLKSFEFHKKYNKRFQKYFEKLIKLNYSFQSELL